MTILKQSTKSSIESRDPDWMTRRGKAEFWMNWDGNKVRVHPFLEDMVATVGFLERPEPMDSEGGPFEPDSRIPEDKQQYLPWAAASYLLSLETKSKNPERAAALMTDFENFIGGTHGRGPVVLPS
jgi:hypothetical protein